MTDAEMAEMLDRLRPRMIGRAVNAGLQEADAEDLTEQVVLYLWRRRRDIDRGGRYAYAWQAFNNRLRNWWRDRDKAVEVEWPLSPVEGTDELREFADRSGGEPVIERESLRKLMAVLDPLDRKLMIDFYWRGYSSAELSRERGYSRTWASVRMYKAREQMRGAAA